MKRKFTKMTTVLALLVALFIPMGMWGQTYNLISDVSDITDGDYVIAAKVGDKYYALSNEFASQISGVEITVSGGVISLSDAEDYVVTIMKDSENRISISNGTNYLNCKSSGTNFEVGNTAYYHVVTKQTQNGSFLIKHQTATRAIIYRTGTINKFGNYATSNVNGSEYYYVELFKYTPSSGSTVTAPTISPNSQSFVNELEVTITPAEGTTAYYTTDGTDPDNNSGTGYTEAHSFTISVTTEVRAIAYNGDESSSIVSKEYTKVTPLANIAALTANTTAGTYFVTMDNAVVTYVNGTNAYLEDVSGAVLLYHCAGDLAVGDKITGTANVTFTVYNNLPEVTAITFVEGYTLTQGNIVTPAVVTIESLEANYTSYISRYVKIENATVTSAFSDKNCTIKQNTSSIVLRDQNSNATLTSTVGDIVTVTAHPSIFNSTHQIAVYEQSQIVVAKVDPTITFNNGTVRVGQTLDLSTLFTSNSTGTVTYSITAGGSYATLSGSTLTGTAEGSVTVKAEQAETSSYNAGEATATITVDPALVLSSIAVTTPPTKTIYDEGESFDPAGMVVTATYSDNSTETVTGYTFSPDGALATTDTEITISYTENNVTKTTTQAITVNEVVDYATLPFQWEGGSSTDFDNLDGTTLSGNGSDYGSNNAPYLIKLDNTGDYIQVKIDSRPDIVTIGVKMIGGATSSSISVQASTDGVTFDDGEALTISGSQNSVLTLTSTREFGENVRYVRLLFTKGSNVGVGPITITKYTPNPIINAPETINLACDATSGEIEYSITRPVENVSLDASSTDEWITGCTVTDTKVLFTTTANTSATEDRTGTITLTYEGAADKTVTIIQSKIDYAILPFVWEGGPKAGLIELTGVTTDGLGTDYASNNAPYYIKLDTDGDYIQVKTDVSPAIVTIGVKMIGGGNNSTITVQSSSNGNDFNDVQVFTISGSQNDVLTFNTTTNAFGTDDRFVRFVFTKGSNVGVGPIIISSQYVDVPTLSINGYADDAVKDGYSLIASPVFVDPANVEGMTDGNIDLYYYNAAEELEWQNYETKPFNLVPGKGYLYAKRATTPGEIFNFTLTGPYIGNGEISLVAGWNLVGNPYNQIAYITGEYYKMNSDGNEIVVGEGNSIDIMQGIFVNAAEAGTMTFSTTAPGKSASSVVMNLSRNRGTAIDRAIVRFDEGNQLPKFQLNPNNTKIYVTEGNQDFAVVRSANQGEMPVSFKAAENGTYTINVDVENMEMDYLHLIDNMTGADVDLLATPSYSFDARTTDYTSRFRLVFSGNGTNENGATTVSETFAYFNGSEWQISNMGEATLQVVDVMGRIVKSETISGNAGVSLNEVPGVYVMRLVNGENVKTQKIVVK